MLVINVYDQSMPRICMYACRYICMHIYMYAYMYVCMYAYMYVCMYVCMHISMYDLNLLSQILKHVAPFKPRFSELELYMCIASLSYIGDPRMLFGENPKKV